jgi:hypothetical protein
MHGTHAATSRNENVPQFLPYLHKFARVRFLFSNYAAMLQRVFSFNFGLNLLVLVLNSFTATVLYLIFSDALIPGPNVIKLLPSVIY